MSSEKRLGAKRWLGLFVFFPTLIFTNQETKMRVGKEITQPQCASPSFQEQPPYSPARTFLFSSFSSFLIFTKRSNIENERVKEKEEKRSWRGMVEVLEDLFLKTWLALKARPPPLGGGKLFVFRLTKDQEQLPFSPERRSAQRWGLRF